MWGRHSTILHDEWKYNSNRERKLEHVDYGGGCANAVIGAVM